MKTYKYDFSLSVVIAVYNDESVLAELYKRLYVVLPTLCPAYEIVFIDDGSVDNSFVKLRQLQAEDENIRIVRLARNFGQASAISAGLDHSYYDVIVIMDSDLQDRPEDIQKLLDAMVKEGKPMSIARWVSRNDGFLKVSASRFFHFVTNRITNLRLEPRLGIFRALRREIVEELKKLPEKTATSLSLLSWMGYDFAIVDLKRDSRHSGSSGYTVRKMMQLSLDRIFSYSLFPIQLSTFSGVAMGILSILMAIYLLFQKLFLKNIVPGWTSLIVVILLLFGINFFFIGIVGEYLGRIFLEAKQRPRYVIGEICEKEEKRDG